MELRAATFNSRGQKLTECMQLMEKHKLHILAVQECKIRTNSTFWVGDYKCITATDIKSGQPGGNPKSKAKAKASTKAKSKAKGKRQPTPKASANANPPIPTGEGDSLHGDQAIDFFEKG